MPYSNPPLLLAACLSFVAALVHVSIIIGGPAWYRFFGAGEAMARMAGDGHWYPALITALIALGLCVAGLYALSGAGVIARLPLVHLVLIIVTCVFCLRGFIGFIIPFVSSHPYVSALGVAFWLWSSAICLVIGMVHLWGLKQAWAYLLQ